VEKADSEHSVVLRLDNGLPRGVLRNPFLPWFNPITRTLSMPIYNSMQQHVLAKECRRLGYTNVLPSGKKTPEGFANETITAWKLKGPYGQKVREDLGTITWAGTYEKKLNPFGAGRFTVDKLTEAEREARKVPGTDLDPWGPAAYVFLSFHSPSPSSSPAPHFGRRD
jgi:hypothetical protein